MEASLAVVDEKECGGGSSGIDPPGSPCFSGRTRPSKGMELTAPSIRSCLALAAGGSSYLALGDRGFQSHRARGQITPSRGPFLAARVLIPSVFVGLGLKRLLVAARIVAGVPASAGTLVFSAFELMAGLLVMVGWKVRWVASLLALFILVDAFLAHAFWAYPAAERPGQLLHFLKNLSTPGGLMLLAWLDAAPTARTSSKPVGTG